MALRSLNLHMAGFTTFELLEVTRLIEFARRNNNCVPLGDWLEAVLSDEMDRRGDSEVLEPRLYEVPMLDPITAADAVKVLSVWLEGRHTPRLFDFGEKLHETAVILCTNAVRAAYHKHPAPEAKLCRA